MLKSRNRAYLCSLCLLPVVSLLGVGSVSPPLDGASSSDLVPPPASGQAVAKLHPALLKRLEEEPGPAKAWVFFTDKAIESPEQFRAALKQVAATYNPRAVERRRLRGDNAARGGELFDQRDLPVVPAYVEAVIATGVHLCVTSTWLNAVSVRATLPQLERIAALPFVDRLEAVGRSRRIEPIDLAEVSGSSLSGGDGPRGMDYGWAAGQHKQINLVALHDAGYTAQNVIIGILDTGFHRAHVAFNHATHPLEVVAEWDFVNNDPNTGIEPGDPENQHRHGTMILGVLAAYKPGSLVGGAYDASFILCKTEDMEGEYPEEEDFYVAGLQFIEANGGDMATSSLGYIDWYTQAQLNGQTAVTTIGVNAATANGVHCCTAAGNEGHDSNPTTSHLLAPSDAFQVIACGAADGGGAIAGFSSDGPTADGRVKPELLARGVSTYTVYHSNETSYATASGTSLSTPLVACAVACLIQAQPAWTVDDMREALFETADYQIEHGTFDPLYIRGYGILNTYAPLQDCNQNGIPDVIDLHNGTAHDCQPNGVLDECEIAAGTSEDCNGNDVPDECDVALPAPVMVDTVAPVLGWTEISTTGTALNLGKNSKTQVTMPFVNEIFPTDSVLVCNDGVLGFGGTRELSGGNRVIPTYAAFSGAQALFPFWDDFNADTGDVYWEVIGTAPDRTFIVEWHDRPHNPGNKTIPDNKVTFQVQVFETPTSGVFAQFLYLDTEFGHPDFDHGRSATVGFQFDGVRGQQWSYNQANKINPGVVLSLQVQGQPTSPDLNKNGIPDECEGLKGDLNCDGKIDFDDIDPFVLALGDKGAYQAQYPNCLWLNADCNKDGHVNFDDVDPFVALLAKP